MAHKKSSVKKVPIKSKQTMWDKFCGLFSSKKV